MSSGQDWTSTAGAARREARDSFGARVESELPVLMRLARRLAGDDQEAEGAVQDALERAWRARGQLRDERATGAWLRSILARVVIDRRRRRRDLPAGASDAVELLLPDVDEPGAVIEAAQDEHALRAALRRLSVDDRVAVVLHDGDGWQASDLAGLLGAGTDATYKRIQRARSRLVSALAETPATGPCPAIGCEAARTHAHELLDGSLSDTDRAAVSAHLDSCACCPAALQAAAGVLAALARDQRSEPIPAAIQARLHGLVRSAATAS